MYSISIKDVENKITKIEAESVQVGLAQYSIGVIKGKLLISVTNKTNGKVKENLIYVPRARFLFSRPAALGVFSRNVERSLI